MRRAVLIAVTLLINTVHTQALEREAQTASTLDADKIFDLSLSLGALSAKAREIVYTTPDDGTNLPAGRRLSQLDWRTFAAPVAKAGVGFDVLRATRIEGSVSIPFSGQSKMTDLDWLSADYYPKWTDRSAHTDTRLGTSFTSDLRLLQHIYGGGGFNIHGMVGWRHTQMSWKAYGGTFVYTESDAGTCQPYGSAQFNGTINYRNCIGRFPNEPLISYRQRFDAPYLGLRFAHEIRGLHIIGNLIGSPIVRSSDRDNHIGATLFKDRFQNQTMISVSGELRYPFAPHWNGFIEAEQQAYLKRKGVGDAIDQETGAYSNFGSGSAGISLYSIRVTAGLRANF